MAIKIDELIDDHSLRERGMYVRESNGDSYAAICPKCKTAGALQLDPHKNTYRCRTCGVAGSIDKLDRLIRHFGVSEIT